MQTERFNINQNDYFEVSVFRYNNEPFVNLRSIHARIDGHDYDRSDNDLRNEIMNHLRERSNVDHINYISERLNHSKWFNSRYLNEETVQPIGWTDNELVLPDEEGHYIPEQLIQSLLVITPEEYEIDDADNLAYYPIYKFFGRKNAASTFHCVHFDILVYILMNRFPRIRADLTRLLTIELEIANTRNMNVDELTRERFIHLQAENERLRGENTNLLARVDHLINQNNQLLERTTGLETQLTTANNKLDQIGEQITGLTDLVGNDLNELNLTTSTAKYIYMVISRPALITEMRNNGTIDASHSCFDTICCLKKDRGDRLTRHGYDHNQDRIELEYECSCSLDLSKWIKRHFNTMTCSELTTPRYRRKIAYLTSSHDEVLHDIANYISRTTHIKTTIIDRLEHLQNIVEDQNEQIQELREEINQLQVSLNEHRPGATKIQSNRLFRDLEIRNGSIYFRPSARADPIELTLEMIMNGDIKFRDANGKLVNLH